nr:MAG TPA: hypothetical protein [Caudoviricetes sp.]
MHGQTAVLKCVVIYHGVGKCLRSRIRKGAVGVKLVQNLR